jgi:hypothetical protein
MEGKSAPLVSRWTTGLDVGTDEAETAAWKEDPARRRRKTQGLRRPAKVSPKSGVYLKEAWEGSEPEGVNLGASAV